MKKTLLAPSLLSADFSDLSGAIKKIENDGGSIVHIDVMDGQFVPQITYGQPVIKSIRKLTDLPFDVHLMVEKPELMVDSLLRRGQTGLHSIMSPPFTLIGLQIIFTIWVKSAVFQLCLPHPCHFFPKFFIWLIWFS